MPKFEYVLKKVVNRERAYPISRLAYKFLELNQARKAKTFTLKQIKLIKEIAQEMSFEIIEHKEK